MGKNNKKQFAASKMLWITTLLLTIYCGHKYYVNTWRIDRKAVNENENLKVIEDRINPNNASWASLARLPGIGETLAKAIVEYRQLNEPEKKQKCFNRCEDLDNVKGIGPAKCAQMRPYLFFNDG